MDGKWIRTYAFIAILAAVAPAHGAEVAGETGAGTVSSDPAKAWERFLAEGELATAYPAYEALGKVGYNAQSGDPTLCSENGDALKAALGVVPVSIALHRAAMLCAEAVGDSAGAERELLALAALSKHAFAQGSDSRESRPIRLLHPRDAYSLLSTSGLEYLYEYYRQLDVQRYFPSVVVAWDPDAKIERHLSFDFVDAISRINRKDRFSGFPFDRQLFANGFVEGLVKENEVLGLDLQATKAAAQVESGKEKIGKLRTVAERGGVLATRAWIAVCALKPFAGCEDGLVDAILPYAEKKHGIAMTLLAYLYAEGIGVKRDATSAATLLDAANRRWPKDGATLEYASMWSALHEGELPQDLRERLAAAESHGNPDARLFLARRKLTAEGKPSLDAADLAYLAQPSRNQMGEGYWLLAFYYGQLKNKQEEEAWTKRAALAGDADAQSDYAFVLLDDEKGPPNRAEGERMMAEGAHGGDRYAQRYMAYLSRQNSRWTDAEGWLMDAVDNGDVQAILDLANMYEWERPGLTGKVGVAVQAYESLAKMDTGAEARRRLAAMALAGRGMKKDPELAKKWLLADAGKADHESEYVLGMAYLRGEFGKVDEAEGTRWMERAIEGKQEYAYADFGHWLYYRKQTPQSRNRAIELWRTGMAAGSDVASNNLAWALCTSPDAAIFDAKAGLATTERMGDVDDMDSASLDTVAACHAAAGDFKRAADLQARAIELLKEDQDTPATATASSDEDDTQGYHDRLALYAKQQRYIEPAVKL